MSIIYQQPPSVINKWPLADILSIKEYLDEQPSDQKKHDIRFAMLIFWTIKTSMIDKKSSNKLKVDKFIKMFNWDFSIEEHEELIKTGKRKPEGMSHIQWATMRQRAREYEEIAKELGLELIA